MREIKFRAWDKKKKKMLYDALLFSFEVGKNFNNNPNLEFMQYTGLKSKSGVEIYEGDIIKCFYYDIDITRDYFSIWSVAYNQKEARFCIGTAHNLGIDNYRDIEVIGNIHENPELLSQEHAE